MSDNALFSARSRGLIPYRRAQRARHGPAFFQSRGKRLGLDAQLPRPLKDRERSIAKRHAHVVPRVIRLLSRRAPAAVAKLVVAVIVYPVNLHLLRAPPHVSKEILKLVPTFAKLNSTSSVILKSRRIGIQATSLDAAPNLIRRSVSHPMGGMRASSDDLSFKAAAGANAAVSKRVRLLNGFGSAVTFACPACVATDVFCSPQGYETPESNSGDIDLFHPIIID